MQNYYGRAIKDSGDDIKTMKFIIFAILFHRCSSDDHPKLVHCPPDERSWCFWQRTVAERKEPRPHKNHETLCDDVVNHQNETLGPIPRASVAHRFLGHRV